jgi:CheY-like chemotaxis protein
MKTILLIEDEPEMRRNLALMLKLETFTVLTADNGRKGVDLAKSEHPDLVLCDVMMPELDGYEVMRRIREQPRHQALPLIAVTAKAMAADREKCIHAGATHYLAKPVDAEQLVSALRVATTV